MNVNKVSKFDFNVMFKNFGIFFVMFIFKNLLFKLISKGDEKGFLFEGFKLIEFLIILIIKLVN